LVVKPLRAARAASIGSGPGAARGFCEIFHKLRAYRASVFIALWFVLEAKLLHFGRSTPGNGFCDEKSGKFRNLWKLY
jgi:hypothetical protein